MKLHEGSHGGVERRFYRVVDLVKIFGVSRSTIDRLVKAGKIPGRLKVGVQVRFLKVAVDNWIERQLGKSR